MKIKWGDTKTGEILKEWELNPSQVRFWDSKKKFVLFSGGYGCQGGETKILDADTGEERRIDSITEPFYVLTHTGKKALAMPPVRYEKVPLYRVSTSNSSFVCTFEHKVLTSGGFRRVSELREGDEIREAIPSLGNPESFLSRVFSYVLHLIQRVQGFRYDYQGGLHFGGVQLQLAGDTFRDVSPLQDDVGKCSRSYAHKDAHLEPSRVRTHDQQGYTVLPSRKNSSSYLSRRHPASDEANRTSSEASVHAFGSVQSSWQSLLSKVRSKMQGWLRNAPYGWFGFSSWSYPTMGVSILSIAYERTDHYYDLHVLGTHSYYAQGFFHHNCGKSLMLTLKAIDLSLRYPNNYILMGRKTYPELRDTLLKEFFDICPDSLIANYLKAEGRVIFPNKSEIIFRHLDTMAESEIRSMNLGGAFIDQAEDISKEVFDGLRGRLRREGVPDEDKKIYLTCNPALTWLFAEFKQKQNPNYEVIEASTLENQKNLPAGYVEDLLKYPEGYKRQYVYGIWDMSLLSEGTVFAREHIEKLMLYSKDPIKEKEGLKIYKEFQTGHRYQMGIDAAEGSLGGDNAAIVIADLDELEEVASFVGKVPPDVLADKAEVFASWYSDKKRLIMVVPEMNSIGLALVNRLKDTGERHFRIFLREEYDKVTKQTISKVGWRTTRQTKPLLVARFQELLRLQNPKIYSRETIEEFKSFVWTDEAKMQGMGAKVGFHDDRIIATLLAFWEKGTVIPGKVGFEKKRSDIMVKNGKLFIPVLMGEKPETSWKSA